MNTNTPLTNNEFGINSADWSATQVSSPNRNGKALPARTLINRSKVSSRGISKSDVALFTSQLSIMCSSGLDLAESLRESAAGCKNPKLRKVLESVYNDVSNGVTASAALAKYESIFGGAYIGSVSAAEASGNVGEVLNRLTDLLRNEIRLGSSLKAIFTYPIALLMIAVLVINALIFFVLPQFSTVFERMGTPAPPFTRFMLDLSLFARQNIFALGIGASIVLAVAYKYTLTDHFRSARDRLLLEFTLFRSATQALITGRVFRLLGTMLQSGVPLLDAIQLCQQSIGNIHYRNLFRDMEQSVVNGQGITPVITKTEYLPQGVSQMVISAEKTGRLANVVSIVGDFYEEDGERQVKQAVKMLEPAIILAMGVLVAGVVASVMLPLLNVSTMSR